MSAITQVSSTVSLQESRVAKATPQGAIASLQIALLIESMKLFKQMMRDEQHYTRDISEKMIMEAASKAKDERLSQGWWGMASGIAGGVLNIASAAFSGVYAANQAFAWADTTSKVTKGLGDASHAIGQGGSSLKSADVGQADALYEKQKRAMDLIDRLRQTNEAALRAIADSADQLIRTWSQRQF